MLRVDQNKTVANELNDLIYFPNGDLNFPFVLANANLLLKEDEVELAVSLFGLITQHKSRAYFGHYGLGQCFLKSGEPDSAALSFERAFRLGRRPFLAYAWIEALISDRKYKEAEKTALLCAVEFAEDLETSNRLREFHRRAVELQLPHEIDRT